MSVAHDELSMLLSARHADNLVEGMTALGRHLTQGAELQRKANELIAAQNDLRRQELALAREMRDHMAAIHGGLTSISTDVTALREVIVRQRANGDAHEPLVTEVAADEIK